MIWVSLLQDSGTGWFYEDRGIPYGGTLSSIHDQSAITWEDDERVRHIRVFALFDSQLVTDAWDGFGWAWYLLGFPL